MGVLGAPGVDGLDEVYVVVDRAGVLRVAFDRGLEGGGADARVLSGRAVAVPVVPRAEIHQRGRVEGGDVVVVRVGLVQCPHRSGVGRVEDLALGLLVIRVARGQRLDHRPLLLAHPVLQGDRGLNRVPRLVPDLVLHHQVEIGAQHQGPAPVRHGVLGIEPGGLLERPQRLGMVEAVGQP